MNTIHVLKILEVHQKRDKLNSLEDFHLSKMSILKPNIIITPHT